MALRQHQTGLAPRPEADGAASDMSRAVRQQTLDICAAFRAADNRGEDRSIVVSNLACLYNVQRPAIWKALRNGGVLPPYARRVDGGKGRPRGGGMPGYSENRRRRSKSQISDEKAEMPRVDRDPCQRCGVRHDIGCHHTRAPVGMVL